MDGLQPTGLEEEIATLRNTLRRVVAEAALSDDLTKSAGTIARLSEALIKAVRAHHVLSGAPQDALQSTVDALLEDAGLGAEWALILEEG
jgi:hypothetical protein